MRLADGVRKGEGRVEIFHDGYWGTVCDDYWDIKDAQVVCRELGYHDAVAAPKEAHFGEGNGHIWLSDVHCLGSESSFEDCEHAEWNANGYCYHSEDASVICANYTASFGMFLLLNQLLCFCLLSVLTDLNVLEETVMWLFKICLSVVVVFMQFQTIYHLADF